MQLRKLRKFCTMKIWSHTVVVYISDAPIIGQISVIGLIGIKSNYRYRLKFSRYFRCIHNIIRREYIVILVAKYLSF